MIFCHITMFQATTHGWDCHCDIINDINHGISAKLPQLWICVYLLWLSTNQKWESALSNGIKSFVHRPRAHFTYNLSFTIQRRKSNFVEIQFLVTTDQITTNFCTCHNNIIAGMSCAKFCSNPFIRIWKRINWISTEFKFWWKNH